MKHLFCLIIIIFPVFCQAQNISGKIVNQLGKPIEYATITLKKDSTVLKAAVSDSAGNYVFNDLIVNNHYKLTYSFVGYKKKDTIIFLKRNINLLSVLLTQDNQLKEVEINNKKKLIERKIDRLVFNVENNVNTVGADALDILSKTPLLRVDNESITLIGKNEVNIMIDDKLIHLSGEALSSYLKTIPAASITKIEVITNPPAQYDAQGNSGLINIVTKKIKTLGFYGVATSNFSRASYNTLYEGLSLNYNLKKILFFGSVFFGNGSRAPSLEQNILYSAQTWNETSKQKEFTNFFSGSFGFEFLLSKNTTLDASYSGSNSKPNLSSDQNTTIIDKNTNLIDSILMANNFHQKKYISNSANVHLNHTIDSLGKQLVVDADFFGVDFDNSGNLNNVNYFANGQMIPNSITKFQSNQDQSSKGYSLNAVLKLPIRKSNILIGGKLSTTKNNSNISLYQNTNDSYKVDSNSTNKFNYNESIQALFANFNSSFGKWEAQLGIRGELTETLGIPSAPNENNKESYFSLFPTFYLTYQLNSVNTFSINYGRRIGRPSYSSFNPFKVYQGIYSYFQGNPNLLPSYSNNIEVSHTYNNVLSTTLSYSRSNNLTTGVTILQNGSNQQMTIIGNFLSSSNYLLDESVDFFLVKWLESTNEFSIYYNSSASSLNLIQSSLKGTGGDFRSLNSIFFNKSKTFIGGVDFDYEFPNVTGVYTFKKYYSLDLSTNYLLFDKKLRLTIEARDIFKTKNVTSYNFVNQVGNFTTANNDSRRFIINVSYSFGNNKLKKARGYSENNDEKGRSGH